MIVETDSVNLATVTFRHPNDVELMTRNPIPM